MNRSAPSLSIPAGLSSGLDALRWISATLVVLTHLNNRLFISFADVPAMDRNVLLYVWTFACGFAHHAVVIFFVLSGFLVGGKLLSDAPNARTGYFKDYFINRASRIYIVLIPVLFITAILDYSATHFLSATAIYSAGGDPFNYSGWAFLGNILNLQQIFTPQFGSDFALWTLANEFWYYMTAPLLFAPLLPGPRLRQWALFGVGAAVNVIFASRFPDHATGLVLWLIGAVAAVIPRALLKPWPSAGVLLLALLAFRAAIRSHQMGDFWIRFATDLVVALCLSHAIVSFRTSPTAMVGGKKTHEWLAGFSYSLYALHTPVIMFCCALMEHYTGFGWKEIPAGPQAALSAAACICAAFGASFLLSRITEAKTSSLKILMRKTLRLLLARGATSTGKA